MNLEEKANDYAKPHSIQYFEFAKIDFIEGGKWIFEQTESIATANPKMYASDLVKELKKLL